MKWRLDVRTKTEIKERLAIVEKDERLGYPPANTEINALLALIQVALETEQRTLRWVLGQI